MLNAIDLAQVPLRTAQRSVDDPLIMAGGHCTYNPEPLADFLDVVVLGDGEEAIGEITRSWPRSGMAPAQATVRRPAPGKTCTANWRRSRVSTSPRCTSALRRPGARRHDPGSSRACPNGIEKRTIADLAECRTRGTSWCRSPRWCTTVSTSRSSAAAPGAVVSARPA
ncbi:MAG: hypothetical protein R2710_22215 [Acidimicrobiales bacterium]